MGYSELWQAGLERIRGIGMEPYLDLGAETRSQNRLNRRNMDSFTFEMRLLDSVEADTSTELFGTKLRAPIIAAAICESRILKRLAPWDPPYLEQIAAGLAEAGSMMSTGMVTYEELGRIVEQGRARAAHRQALQGRRPRAQEPGARRRPRLRRGRHGRGRHLP